VKFVPILAVVCSTSCRSRDTLDERTTVLPSPSPTRGQALVRIADPPERPPRVQLLGREDADDTWRRLQTGSLFNGEWIASSGELRELGSGRVRNSFVPWPRISTFGGVQELAVLIPTLAAPRTLNVSIFRKDLRTNGAPQSKAIYESQCDLSMILTREGACSRRLADKKQILQIKGFTVPASPFRMAVNISWANPRAPDTNSSVVWATWLFFGSAHS
jgi:hypothetical protein